MTRQGREKCPRSECDGLIKEIITFSPYDPRNILYVCDKCNLMVRNGNKTPYCIRCQQLNFNAGKKFHWCGDATKQCELCGHDWPANRCPKCYKVFNGLSCKCSKEKVVKPEEEPVIQQITLPYDFEDEHGQTCKMMGWHAPMRLIIAMPDGNDMILSEKNSLAVLHSLSLSPENIPGWNKRNRPSLIRAARESMRERMKERNIRIEYMTPEEWEAWERFKEQYDEMLEASDEILSNWKDHIRYIEEEYSHFEEEVSGLEDPIRRMPRILRYIKTGNMPSMNEDDDNLAYYDDDVRLSERWEFYTTPTKRGKQKVKVIIEDISDGKL